MTCATQGACARARATPRRAPHHAARAAPTPALCCPCITPMPCRQVRRCADLAMPKVDWRPAVVRAACCVRASRMRARERREGGREGRVGGRERARVRASEVHTRPTRERCHRNARLMRGAKAGADMPCTQAHIGCNMLVAFGPSGIPKHV